MKTRKCDKPRVIEMFAGTGLLGYAFKVEGFQLVQAVEIEQPAVETYRLNLGEHIECKDVRLAKPISVCDVLIAGPPCQGFSTLGRQRVDDPRNKLCHEITKWARHAKPSIIVIENVEAFVDSPHWHKLRRSCIRQGYSVHKHILNAADYGVPQLRRRSFTIASRLDLPEFKPIRNTGAATVRDAWKGLPKRPNGKNYHYAPKPTPLALSRMRVIPPGGDKRDVMENAPELVPESWWKVSNQATDVWGRMLWDQPCNTLRTCLLNPSKGRYTHPTQNRVITLREAARLHSIPDTWQFFGKPTQVARQIGNSVPLLLGRAIARSVMTALRN